MFGIYISRRWKWPKVLIALMLLELGGTVAALALFGIAQPNLFRNKMWQVGYENGFNSDPNQVLYAYANHRPIPKIPFVWSQAITDYNVAVSVFAMFVLLVKAVMFVLHIWYPLLGTISNAIITVLWIVSMYGQMGPDHNDPRYPSNVAWYINKSCSYAHSHNWEHYCVLAKSTFAVTVLMAAIFLANMLLGIYSMIPSRDERALQMLEVDDMMQTKHSPSSDKDFDKWEMKTVPNTTSNTQPFTPRTLAFNTLERKLPLRAAASEGRWA